MISLLASKKRLYYWHNYGSSWLIIFEVELVDSCCILLQLLEAIAELGRRALEHSIGEPLLPRVTLPDLSTTTECLGQEKSESSSSWHVTYVAAKDTSRRGRS